MADDFLKRNALRLLREKWDSPSALAQELYTILADESSGALSTRSAVAQDRQDSAAKSAAIPQLEQSPRALRLLPGVPGTSFEDLSQKIAASASPVVEQVRKPGFMPGITVVPGMLPPGDVQYVEPPGSRADQIVWRQPQQYARPAREEPASLSSDLTWERVRHDYARSTSVSVAATGVSPTISRSSSAHLPLPAHVEFGVSPTALAYSYPPLGLPGAYSGQERPAGDDNPVNGPVFREEAIDDPFARKYYDLRFFLPDFDTVRATGGDSSSTVLIGKVTTASVSPVQVTLYPDGPNSDPSPASAVSVTILQLDPSEVVPANTWITGIQQASDGYYAQLPIWLSDGSSNE